MTLLNLRSNDVKSFYFTEVLVKIVGHLMKIKNRKASQLRSDLSETRMNCMHNSWLDTLTRDSLRKILKCSLRRLEGKLFPDSFYSVSYLRIFDTFKHLRRFFKRSIWTLKLLFFIGPKK